MREINTMAWVGGDEPAIDRGWIEETGARESNDKDQNVFAWLAPQPQAWF